MVGLTAGAAGTLPGAAGTVHRLHGSLHRCPPSHPNQHWRGRNDSRVLGTPDQYQATDCEHNPTALRSARVWVFRQTSITEP